jgi:hypothetical protein
LVVLTFSTYKYLYPQVEFPNFDIEIFDYERRLSEDNSILENANLIIYVLGNKSELQQLKEASACLLIGRNNIDYDFTKMNFQPDIRKKKMNILFREFGKKSARYRVENEQQHQSQHTTEVTVTTPFMDTKLLVDVTLLPFESEAFANKLLDMTSNDENARRRLSWSNTIYKKLIRLYTTRRLNSSLRKICKRDELDNNREPIELQSSHFQLGNWRDLY